MSNLAPVPKPEPEQIGTNEHDSASQAYIAGLISVCVTLLGVGLIVAAVLSPDSRPYCLTIVGGIITGFFAQLNAPSGIASVIASAAKSLGHR